ncbi:DUF3144 domain-containing protein [Dokdonella soli]|uniref:DUF3144 domain-containing protein n=1 Tax=Dokdonella soli TaxID=529810 RepID=A0ABN1IE93_9GAMM
MNEPQDITEDQFFEMVDRFINQANDFARQFPQPRVSAAILFAAARYNAFNWVNRSQMLEQTLDEATILFRAEYENMFRDNARGLTEARASG